MGLTERKTLSGSWGAVRRRVQSNLPAMILIVTSIASAVAAAANLKIWVAVAASAAAVISGIRVLYTDLVVPLRSRKIYEATATVLAYDDQPGQARRGTAVQVAPGQWLTIGHVVRGANTVQVVVENDRLDAQVLFADEETNIAVLETGITTVQVAKVTTLVPEPGDKLTAAGWSTYASYSGHETHRVSLEYTMQGIVDETEVLLTGPSPSAGFAGAPVIDVRIGRVVGIVTSRQEGEFAHLNVTRARILNQLPQKYLPRRSLLRIRANK